MARISSAPEEITSLNRLRWQGIKYLLLSTLHSMHWLLRDKIYPNIRKGLFRCEQHFKHGFLYKYRVPGSLIYNGDAQK